MYAHVAPPRHVTFRRVVLLLSSRHSRHTFSPFILFLFLPSGLASPHPFSLSLAVVFSVLPVKERPDFLEFVQSPLLVSLPQRPDCPSSLLSFSCFCFVPRSTVRRVRGKAGPLIGLDPVQIDRGPLAVRDHARSPGRSVCRPAALLRRLRFCRFLFSLFFIFFFFAMSLSP